MRKMTLLLGAIAAMIFLPTMAGDKIKVESNEDLPRFTYNVDGKLTDFIQSDDFPAFARKRRDDVVSVLDRYELTDATTLKGYYGLILNVQMLEGDFEAARRSIAKIRTLEDKPALKLLTGVMFTALMDADGGTGEMSGEAIRARFEHNYSTALSELPWDVVQDSVERSKAGWEIRSRNFYLGLVESQYQEGVNKSGNISGDVADTMIGVRLMLDRLLPVKDNAIAALSGYIDANRVEKPDIWQERYVDLGPTDKAQPVTVAIWDSGTDTALYEGRLYTNPKEKLDGRDTDGNGWVDDLHGIGHTLKSDRTSNLMIPLTDDQRSQYPEMKAMVKGLTDMQAAIDSTEASALKKYLSELQPNEVKAFIEEISLFGNFAHGTHVAGIAAEGNPFIRILVARLTFDHKMIPDTPTVEQTKKDAQAVRDTIDYFKANGVRVVNMSWGGNLSSYESALELNGVGESAEERLAMAKEMFDIFNAALKESIAGAPDILFVTSAGNSDNDAEFDMMYPSSYELPNILTVGAVDQAGEETSFTTFGSNVDLHANGFEVESYVPGGDRMAMSGTSMSSPNVVNLAAKLLAKNPELTVAELRERIIAGSDHMDDGRRVLINPRATIARR
ncbi:MAG: S8 family serine peptidase [Gammaproteobacteria bacterium]|nr:MAG: S8 family serine peptidase [Gammaproteobacteria bacterium]